jgi:hypothetical protein
MSALNHYSLKHEQSANVADDLPAFLHVDLLKDPHDAYHDTLGHLGPLRCKISWGKLSGAHPKIHKLQ